MSVSVCSISHLGAQSDFLVLLILVSCSALILPIPNCKLNGEEKGKYTFASYFFSFSCIWGISFFFNICWSQTELSDHSHELPDGTSLSLNLMVGTGSSTQPLVVKSKAREPHALSSEKTLVKVFRQNSSATHI